MQFPPVCKLLCQTSSRQWTLCRQWDVRLGRLHGPDIVRHRLWCSSDRRGTPVQWFLHRPMVLTPLPAYVTHRLNWSHGDSSPFRAWFFPLITSSTNTNSKRFSCPWVSRHFECPASRAKLTNFQLTRAYSVRKRLFHVIVFYFQQMPFFAKTAIGFFLSLKHTKKEKKKEK